MMKYVILCLAVIATVHAESLDGELSDFQGEGRLLFNTSTFTVPDIRAVVALIAIGIVVATYYLRSAPLPAPAAYDKNYYDNAYDYYSQDQAYANGQGSFNARYGISNLATKMSQLETAFKKFEVETEECQKFVACEAAQIHKLKKNSPVINIVNRILSNPGDESKVNPTVLAAFRQGQAEYQGQKVNACESLREVCYAAHSAAANIQ